MKKIEDYCNDKGEYIFPKADPDNTLLARDILAFFKSAHTFKNLTIYAKPFSKISLNRQSYDDQISAPAYIMRDSDKDMEIFVNGEVKKNNRSRTETKTKVGVCLEAVDVEERSFKDSEIMHETFESVLADHKQVLN